MTPDVPSIEPIAVVRDPALLTDAEGTAIEGTDGAPLRAVCASGLAAIVQHAAPTASANAAVDPIELNDVLLDLIDLQPTVPVRAGARFTTDQAVRDWLRSASMRFELALERIAGCVEIAVGLPKHPRQGPDAAPGQTSPGMSYLARRQRELAASDGIDPRAAALAGRVRHGLCSTPCGVRDVRPLPASTISPVRLAMLVEIDQIAPAASAAASLLDREGASEVTLTGPFACWSFVEAITRHE